MNTPDPAAGWRKSSHSGNNSGGNCVETALVDSRGEYTGVAR